MLRWGRQYLSNVLDSTDEDINKLKPLCEADQLMSAS